MYKKFDYTLLIATLLLCIIGMFSVYSATRTFGTSTHFTVQLGAGAVGVVLMLIISLFDYEELLPFGKYIFVLSVLVLVGVLFLGMTGIWGSKSWIKIGPVSVQPSEFIKCTFIISLSAHLSKLGERINTFRGFSCLCLHLVGIVSLIMLQPDFGTAVVFVFIFCVMVFCGGLSLKIIIPAIFGGVALSPLIYCLLDDYQKNRIKVFLNPELDPLGSGYNVIRSKLTLGSGEIFGRGYLEGVSTGTGYLPAKHTDFIFSSVCEELGFVGGSFIIFLTFFIIIRAFKIAAKSDDAFGKFICIGAGANLLFHAVENIGMCMGLMPVTGIPLPFVSYGGSSLVASFILIGMVLSVSSHTIGDRIFE